jgi:hypothetical protein
MTIKQKKEQRKISENVAAKGFSTSCVMPVIPFFLLVHHINPLPQFLSVLNDDDCKNDGLVITSQVHGPVEERNLNHF